MKKFEKKKKTRNSLFFVPKKKTWKPFRSNGEEEEILFDFEMENLKMRLNHKPQFNFMTESWNFSC